MAGPHVRQKMKKHSYRPGDILQIPLPDGGICYGRMYRDSTIGVYLRRHAGIPDLTSFDRNPDLVAGIFTKDLPKMGWVTCTHYAFHSDDDEWAPPVYSRDILDPTKVRIYHRGALQAASESEVEGLDPQLIYKPDQLAQEIARRISSTSENEQ